VFADLDGCLTAFRIEEGHHAGMASEWTELDVEEAICSVEIAISRRADGRYVARTSFNEEAGWESCSARDAPTALGRAARIAQRRLIGRQD
jgi:hypothetical protein